jgi:hypothetical protein
MLTIAVRYRTSRSLGEVLNVLFAQKLVTQGPCEIVCWRTYDRVVGPGAAKRIPVFEDDLLASVIEALDDS